MTGGGSTTWRLVGVAAGLLLAGTLIGLYISQYLVGNTPSFSPPVRSGAADLTIETVAAVGPELAPNHPDWVSYLVREGSTNPEIAERLFIGRRTVRAHLSNIYTKLGVTNRTEAVTVARRRGFID